MIPNNDYYTKSPPDLAEWEGFPDESFKLISAGILLFLPYTYGTAYILHGPLTWHAV
jgi:hypothetical protein